MTSDRFVEVKRLFIELLELPGEERARRLAELADTDADLHARLEALMEQDAAPRPPEDRATPPGGTGDVDPADAPADMLDRERVGPYRVIEEIGRGGQGVVYLAEDTRLERKVALKVLRGLGPGAAGVLLRFKREAQAASRADHPGVCAVYDADVDGGVPYIAMRYIAGESFAKRIATTRDRQIADTPTTEIRLDELGVHGDGATPADTAPTPSGRYGRSDLMRLVRLVEKTARALHAVHEAGVVHRDVKPGNLMITRDDEPVIMDFGLARDEESNLESLTRSGDFFGTPAYMSPEQLTSQRIHLDRRTDVWSLGVMLYECVTLQRPFDAPSREGLYQQILAKEPTNPLRVNPAIPQDLATVIQAAIEKDRDRRYQTAQDLAEDLRRVRAHEPILAKPVSAWGHLVRWSRRNRGIAASVAASVLILIAGIVVATRLAIVAEDARSEAEDARSRLDAMTLRPRLRDHLAQADVKTRPPIPEKLPAMAKWLDEARKFVEALSKQNEEHPELATARSMIAIVVNRQEEARELERSWEAARKDWDRSIKEVASPDSPYKDLQLAKGLQLAPEVGLIPLGKDPDSGLWEFWHQLSGERPGPSPRKEDGITLVLIPGGTFTPGARKGDPDADANEAPGEGSVKLGPFFLSKFEVTQAQWKRIFGNNPSNLQQGQEINGQDITWRHPVTRVTWEDCTEACRRWNLALPTEAQWEWACRGNTKTRFHTGDEVASLKDYANISDKTRAERYSRPSSEFEIEDGYAETAPVGSFRASDFALHDMHGNVLEWCRDEYFGYGDSYPGSYDGLRKHKGGLKGEMRVYRGGSYEDEGKYARSSARIQRGPSDDDNIRDVGLRPAMSIQNALR